MMAAHARASQRKIYFFSIKVRTARQQLFSSIDCFDVLENGNECGGPIEDEELLRNKRVEKRA
jgi:hypothetical protein